MALTLSVVSNDDVVHVLADGDATSVDFPAGNSVRFDSLLGDGWNSRRVLLDMERVSYIDSSAIGWLIASQRAFRAGGGQLALHSLAPAVRGVLDMLKIGRIVPFASDAEAGRTLLLDPAAAAAH